MSEITQIPYQANIMHLADLQKYAKFSSTLIEELTLTMENQTIGAKFMDPSHVTLCEWQIPTLGQLGRTGVRSDEFAKTLARFSGESIDISQKDYMKFRAGKKTIELRQIEPSNENVPTPKIVDFQQFGLKFKQFQEISKDLRPIGADYLTMYLHGSKMEYSATSDQGSIIDEIEIDGYFETGIRSTYSMEWLESPKILKADMVCSIAKDKPLKIVIGSKDSGPYIEYWQAPRVES